MIPLVCPAHHEAIPGPLWTDADAAAWHLEHAACAPVAAPAPVPVGRNITCDSDEAALALVRELRPTHVVGRVGVQVFARPRGAR